MSYLNALLTDLRDRKLWPVPLVLLAALVAVPVLLSKSPAAPQNSPSPGLGIASQSPNAVTVDATPVQAPLGPGSRDPFTQQKLASATTTKAATPSSGVTVSGATSGPSVAKGSSTASGSAGSTSSTATGSTGSSPGNGYYTGGGTVGARPGRPTHPAAPAAGLRATQSYQVQVGLPSGSGFNNVLAPRGTELPSQAHPQLVELGVEQGGSRVLFAVAPGTVVSGSGTCVPGPLDCEILALSPNQTEDVAVQSATGPHSVGTFTLSAIFTHTWGSVAQAKAQRSASDSRGERLLASSPERALTLFSYNPSLGVVVDERNLQVGGN